MHYVLQHESFGLRIVVHQVKYSLLKALLQSENSFSYHCGFPDHTCETSILTTSSKVALTKVFHGTQATLLLNSQANSEWASSSSCVYIFTLPY